MAPSQQRAAPAAEDSPTAPTTTATPSTTAAQTSPAATAWDIDPAHSSTEFEVRHLGISFVSGRFRAPTGSIRLDGARPGEVEVQARIEAASVDTGVPDRDAHLRSPDFFDVAQHPAIQFVGRRVEASPPGADGGIEEATLVGDLTLRGVTREVPLRVERTGEVTDPWGKRRVAATATATLSLKDFGITWNQPLEGGGLLLGDKVQVRLRIQAVERAAAADGASPTA